MLVVALALVAGACSSKPGSSTASGSTAASTTSTTARSKVDIATPASIDRDPSAATASTTTTTTAPGTPATSPAAGLDAYPVGTLTVTYVDRKRGTAANHGAAARPDRTLKTFILFPATGPANSATISNAPARPGPWPLIVFSHGVGGNGPAYANTLRHLASSGYLVVAPDYPLSHSTTPGGAVITDVPEQTADVAFLIDQVLAASRAAGPLHGLADPARIGLAGHSLGAVTSLGAGYEACCAEHRVKAVAEWAGVLVPLRGSVLLDPRTAHVPLLIVHGDADRTVHYDAAANVYDHVGTPKLFITLPGSGHVPPYVQGLRTPASTVATTSTIAFFDAYLKGDASGVTRLRAAVGAAGPAVATLREQLS